ncbi:MAG: hypothetical protein CMO01_32730 [Thalassobius sp.]|nr:hypothetical protein [Thalassovita sp.]
MKQALLLLFFFTSFNLCFAQINSIYRISSIGHIYSNDSVNISSFSGAAMETSFASSEVSVSPFQVTNSASEITAIHDRTEQDKYQIYPNPFSEKLYIESPSNNSVLELYTNTGILILSQNILKDENLFKVSNLKNGIYLIKILDQQGLVIKSQKLIKN